VNWLVRDFVLWLERNQQSNLNRHQLIEAVPAPFFPGGSTLTRLLLGDKMPCGLPGEMLLLEPRPGLIEPGVVRSGGIVGELLLTGVVVPLLTLELLPALLPPPLSRLPEGAAMISLPFFLPKLPLEAGEVAGEAAALEVVEFALLLSATRLLSGPGPAG
jgi:hypothetical protein